MLIATKIDNDKVTFEAIYMEPKVVRNVWHKIAMKPESKVLIFENPDTHLGDFEFYELSKEQKSVLYSVVNAAIKQQGYGK